MIPRLRSSARKRTAGASAVSAWLATGVVAFALLPWYFQPDMTLLQALAGVFDGADTSSGVVQAAQHARPWLWLALGGLAVAALAARFAAGRRQGAWLAGGALFGALGVLASGFAIGARGWAFSWMTPAFGALPVGQTGIGLGGALTLLALLMLLGAGVARLGWFRGDVFTACAVVLCASLLLLFVALPVAEALAGAFVDESGRLSLTALAGRIVNERTWGLGCLAGGVRCGVAWNTLFLALLTATGTTRSAR